MRTNTALAVELALSVGRVCSHAVADDWEFAPRLRARLRVQRQLSSRLSGRRDRRVGRRCLMSRLPLQLVESRYAAWRSRRVSARRYFPDDRDEDSTDYFLTGMFEQRRQRQLFGIDGEESARCRRSELPGSDEDREFGRADHGRFGPSAIAQSTRSASHHALLALRRQSTPSRRSRRLLPRCRLRKGYFRMRNRTSPTAGTMAYAGWGYLSGRSALRSHFAVEHRAMKQFSMSDAYGAEVEWRSEYSQTAQVYLRLGGQQTDLDRSGGTTGNECNWRRRWALGLADHECCLRI